MKFKLLVAHTVTADQPWRETYDRHEIETLAQAEAWGVKAINEFNATLRPNERPRIYLGVEDDGPSTAPREHEWRKTNLVTLDDKARGAYDRVQCQRCGAVARRYGLQTIVRQDPYRTKKWNTCPNDNQQEN